MSSASPTRPWDVHRLPSAAGRSFLVTGGNAGIGSGGGVSPSPLTCPTRPSPPACGP